MYKYDNNKIELPDLLDLFDIHSLTGKMFIFSSFRRDINWFP